jgi:hypothetical protein
MDSTFRLFVTSAAGAAGFNPAASLFENLPSRAIHPEDDLIKAIDIPEREQPRREATGRCNQ